LIKWFRIAAESRNKLLKAGATDNVGAIHSATRILEILGSQLKYKDVGHINNLRHWPYAEFSVKAKAAYRRGQRVLTEHVSPMRELTCKAIEKTKYKSDGPLLRLIGTHYRLVLLTPEETTKLNRQNRSKIDPGRLAGIKMAPVPSRRGLTIVAPRESLRRRISRPTPTR
jgi:hypothetical protein